jgi:copper chaperone CopZ
VLFANFASSNSYFTMTHTYKIGGMTCSSCAAKVKHALLSMPDVLSAEVSLEKSEAVIQMEKHIALAELQKNISGAGNYTITAIGAHDREMPGSGKAPTWLQTYKPILLIFAFIAVASALAEYTAGSFNLMRWMNHFMAGFFLTFSFFKLLSLREFADSYKTYDIPAKFIPGYAYAYPFIELGLGMAFLAGLSPFAVNLTAFMVMGISSIGVIMSLLDKKKIQCACLGAVFKLPMSTVTLFEDLLMAAMSGYMLLNM